MNLPLHRGAVENLHAVVRGDEDPVAGLAAGQRAILAGPIAARLVSDDPRLAFFRGSGGNGVFGFHCDVQQGVDL